MLLWILGSARARVLGIWKRRKKTGAVREFGFWIPNSFNRFLSILLLVLQRVFFASCHCLIQTFLQMSMSILKSLTDVPNSPKSGTSRRTRSWDDDFEIRAKITRPSVEFPTSGDSKKKKTFCLPMSFTSRWIIERRQFEQHKSFWFCTVSDWNAKDTWLRI